MRLLTCAFLLIFSQFSFAKEFNGFNVANALIDVDELMQGGPPRDGIPAINDPRYVEANAADFLKKDDTVLGLYFEGVALAYPRHILNWHEIVNDEIKGRPFLVSYCPLCGSGMAFSAQLDKDNLIFGVSGLLYNSDLVLYDRNSQSLWSQLWGKGISGKYAGRTLKQLHLQSTTWANWSAQFPKTRVLSEDQGYKRNYRHDPYTGYETSNQLFFKTLRQTPADFHVKERVLGIKVGEVTKAYPFVELRHRGAATFVDRIGEKSYRVRWNPVHETASIEQLDGENLVTTVAYWFAWYNFYPDTLVYRAVQP